MTLWPAHWTTRAGGAADAGVLEALASPTRQPIMMLFRKGAELSVNEVAEQAGVRQSTASQHQAILRAGGIVRCLGRDLAGSTINSGSDAWS
ncbi:MAG TPA: helix-turn-helix domain-containing protein [Microlunatus sp.]